MNYRNTLIALLLLTTGGCSNNRMEALAPFSGPEGISIAPVEIESSPSTAWIYIDG